MVFLYLLAWSTAMSLIFLTAVSICPSSLVNWPRLRSILDSVSGRMEGACRELYLYFLKIFLELPVASTSPGWLWGTGPRPGCPPRPSACPRSSACRQSPWWSVSTPGRRSRAQVTRGRHVSDGHQDIFWLADPYNHPIIVKNFAIPTCVPTYFYSTVYTVQSNFKSFDFKCGLMRFCWNLQQVSSFLEKHFELYSTRVIPIFQLLTTGVTIQNFIILALFSVYFWLFGDKGIWCCNLCVQIITLTF